MRNSCCTVGMLFPCCNTQGHWIFLIGYSCLWSLQLNWDGKCLFMDEVNSADIKAQTNEGLVAGPVLAGEGIHN